jgi:galactonate dehydratase
VLTAAVSAIDIALHDIVARSLGIPVYQLLGGRQRDEIPCFATCTMRSEQQLLDNARKLIGAGWSVIRTGFADGGAESGVFEPRQSIAKTAQWLTSLRGEIGRAAVLGTDYHHRLTVAEAASFCQRMPSGTLDFLEEPIRDESPQAYEALRAMTDVPFAIGEEFSSKWQSAPYIERGITNFARIDLCNVGGFTESMKVAAMAETHYIDLMPHNPLGPVCTAATVHLAAAVPNLAWMEIRESPTEEAALADDTLFPSRLTPRGDRIPVPDGPGLGVSFSEEAAEEQAFKFWEAPHLRREDGSYTNW